MQDECPADFLLERMEPTLRDLADAVRLMYLIVAWISYRAFYSVGKAPYIPF